jgi:hypothetical protein
MNPKISYWLGAVLAAAMSVCAPLAKADETTSSPTQINKLLEEINAYETLCSNVTAKDEALYRQCAAKQAPLLKRQKQLGVSNKDVNGKLQTRGWRWP